MEIEQLKNIIKEETQKQIINNLDSSIIFTYISNLEEKNEKLEKYYQCEKNLLDNYIHKDKIKEKAKYYQELYKQDNSPNEFLISQNCLSKLSFAQELLEEGN